MTLKFSAKQRRLSPKANKMDSQQTITVLQSDWYDKAQTMKKLNIAERTLQTWTKDGRIRFKMQSVKGKRPERVYRAADVEKIRDAGPPASERKEVAVREPAPAKPPSLESQAFLLLCTELREQRKAEFETRERERAVSFLTLPEAAAYLRLPKAYVLRAIQEGRLEAVRAGGWKIQQRSLQRFKG